MRFANIRQRPWRSGGMLGAALLLACMVIAQPAAAWTPKTPGNCPEITWEEQPRLLLHTSEFTDGSDSLMLDAIRDVVDQFNLAGGTSARVTTVEESTESFVFGTWFGDATSTIHVGVTTDPSVAGEEATGPVSACQYDESHIQFNVTDTTWNFGTPGEDYYQAGESDSGGRFFRPVFLHELLHAFGLVHSSSTYSYLNAGSRPWANRPLDQAIRPLPDELRALRHLYHADDPRTEIAVLNTWYNEDILTTVGVPAATQQLLCQPNRGKDFSASIFDDYCGTGGDHSTEVCDGQNLRVQFAVANYSTTPVDTTVQLWFSYDDQFDWGAPDVASPTSYYLHLNSTVSAQRGYTFEVPDIAEVPGTAFHTLLRVVAVPEGEPEDVTTAVTSDWIPLRGTVEIC